MASERSFGSGTSAGATSAGRPIVYVLTHHPRTALTFIADEIRALERDGWTVVPVAMKSPAPSDLGSAWARAQAERTVYLDRLGFARLVAALAGVTLRHPIRVWSVWKRVLTSAGPDVGLMARRIGHLAYACVVRDVARANGADHVHAHFGLSPANIAWFTSLVADLDRGRRLTWSFTIHGFHDFADHRLARLDLKAAAADFVVCISSFTRAQLCNLSEPVLWSRFHIVRCGLEMERFPVRPTAQERSDGPPTVLVVARLSPEKGHGVLIRAARLLRRGGRDIRLEFVGSGPFEDEIRADARRWGVDVNFIGELAPDDVRDRLVAADVFCLPSFAEGLPVSIMEAMATGVPVVASNVGGVAELVRHGETGLTVAAGDEEQLAAALDHLLSDRSDRVAMVAAAREAVVAAHSLDESSRQLASLFSEVAAD